MKSFVVVKDVVFLNVVDYAFWEVNGGHSGFGRGFVRFSHQVNGFTDFDVTFFLWSIHV